MDVNRILKDGTVIPDCGGRRLAERLKERGLRKSEHEI